VVRGGTPQSDRLVVRDMEFDRAVVVALTQVAAIGQGTVVAQDLGIAQIGEVAQGTQAVQRAEPVVAGQVWPQGSAPSRLGLAEWTFAGRIAYRMHCRLDFRTHKLCRISPWCSSIVCSVHVIPHEVPHH